MQVSIPTIFRSKKFVASVLASGVSLLGFKYGLDQTQVAFAVAPLMLFTGAQGLADVGKSKALIEAGETKEPVQ